MDRLVQQATAQQLSRIFDVHFSESSYGFRPNRGVYQVIEKVLDYLNEGYEWPIDIEIEKLF